MLKTILDFLKDSKETSQERLKLPVVQIYIFLILLSYWKGVAIFLFSAATIESKIEEIDLFSKTTIIYSQH